MAGIAGGCNGLEPILAEGDTVIKTTQEIFSGAFIFPTSEELPQNIIDSVIIQVT